MRLPRAGQNGAEARCHRALLQGHTRCVRRQPRLARVPRPVLGGVSGATLQTFVDKAITALEAGTLDGREDTIFRWMPLLLDQNGWDDVVAIMEEATEKVLAAQRRSQDRLAARGGKEAISTVIGLASFETGGSLRE